MTRRHRKHWYFITVFYCPVCARDTTYRERRYGRRPKKREDRGKFIEAYDWCDAL